LKLTEISTGEPESPNAPLSAAVTALAPAAVTPAPTFAANSEQPCHRAAARYLWAMLLIIFREFGNENWH
jgi:hypothetical protein